MNRMLVVAMLALSTSAAAQDPKSDRLDGIDPQDARKPMAAESFAKCLFPPELIMERQSDIGLDAMQRAKIIDEMSRAQLTFTKLQWEMTTVQQQIMRELRRSVVDESVLKQFDAMLALENQLKRTQLELLIRVKNVLTPQQQRQLSPNPNKPPPSGERVAQNAACSQ